ncbi:alginate lyase family protein [Ruegeria sp. ANG-S4]|uniref:alginate lyase family protein n=1 Tax=Ruegeria sp. ANG-S4 TaxID=1577904 RepID=UPI0009E31CA0|nr:alginate lyase family protein [Ruegeria sp. ANG-S4]
MTANAKGGTKAPASSHDKKVRRNRLLLLLSPLIVLFSPVLLPVYYVMRRRKGKPLFGSRKRATRSPVAPVGQMGRIAGSLDRVPPAPIDMAEEERIDAMPDTFALCRVIGNDLVPRHKAGQSLENVRFILENEPELSNCRKLWVLNRIFDPENEARLINLLEQHGQDYERIPYDADALQSTGFDFSTIEDPMVFVDGRLDQLDEKCRLPLIAQAYRLRNNYVMNNNGARNVALGLCLKHAKWALPFDGNCYFTESAWQAVRSDIMSRRDKRYFTVPMARMLDNQDLLADDVTPNATEEPQLAFRCDAPLRFDEAHPYGRRPKVELFLHLGIPGPWEKWPVARFDIPPRKVSPEGHRVGQAGWVARLFSGQAQLEQDTGNTIRDRGVARNQAIRATLDMLEARPVRAQASSGQPVFYSAAELDALSASPADPDYDAIQATADAALTRGPFSVVDKPDPGPSGDKHDYFHPAPYWWPNSKKADGLPYVRRDGHRVPGTGLYEPDSDRFDRTRLQRMFDDTTALALAARITGDEAYRDHAKALIRTWFLEPATRMNPNLFYAQVRRGHNNDRGSDNGLIETKDFYFFLDAVRLLQHDEISSGVQSWCAEFLNWLKTSDQGIKECRNENNHGTCFDLQEAALAAFLGDADCLQQVNLRAQARLLGTIEENGAQPHELTRTMTQHYCVFNVQSWINLFNLMEGAGLRPWDSAAADRLVQAMRLVLRDSANGWPNAQAEPFDLARLAPIDQELCRRTGQGVLQIETPPACFHPHDGIAPFWRQARWGSAK